MKPEKFMLLQDSIEFYGIVFTRDGIKPNPKKVQAFTSTSPSINMSEVRNLLGMSNYCSDVIPDYATIDYRAIMETDTKTRKIPVVT